MFLPKEPDVVLLYKADMVKFVPDEDDVDTRVMADCRGVRSGSNESKSDSSVCWDWDISVTRASSRKSSVK